jgi:CRP/FNR family cyclic AMP-dependent transcriptional regulator
MVLHACRSSARTGEEGHMADRRVEMLARVPLFVGSSKRQLSGILEWTKEYRYKPGATIVREGANGQELFVILEGKASLSRKGKTITRLLPGDFFGEMAVIDGRPRSATVVADEDVDCLVLKKADFRAMVEGDPSIAWHLLKTFAARLRRD